MDGLIRKQPQALQREMMTGFHAQATNEDDDNFHIDAKEELQAN